MIPGNQKHPKVFYGWWVVVSGSLVMLYTSGIIHFGFTAVFEPIANEFGWSYTQISLAASLRGLETGLLAPAIGLLVDRWGPRNLVFGGSFITGLGLILLSNTNSLGMFYGAFVVISVGSSCTGHAVMMAAIVNWFRRRVTIATGIMASGAALGGLLVPLIVLLVDLFEWRMAMLILGLGTWVICLPLSLLVRNNPAQYGYMPDGDERGTSYDSKILAPSHGIKIDSSAKEALKNRAFWHITLAMAYHALVMSAVLTHVMPYLGSIGIDRLTSSLVASALPVASILGRLGFGWFGDRLDKRRVAASGFALLGVGLLLFSYISPAGIWLLLPFLIIFGLGYGGNVTIRAALLQEYFGRERFGTIHGFTIGVMTLGSMAGAPLAGWVFDQKHSYQGAWLALAAFSVIAMLVMANTPRPKTAIS